VQGDQDELKRFVDEDNHTVLAGIRACKQAGSSETAMALIKTCEARWAQGPLAPDRHRGGEDEVWRCNITAVAAHVCIFWESKSPQRQELQSPCLCCYDTIVSHPIPSHPNPPDPIPSQVCRLTLTGDRTAAAFRLNAPLCPRLCTFVLDGYLTIFFAINIQTAVRQLGICARPQRPRFRRHPASAGKRHEERGSVLDERREGALIRSHHMRHVGLVYCGHRALLLLETC